jgi:hypothetical protein
MEPDCDRAGRGDGGKNGIQVLRRHGIESGEIVLESTSMNTCREEVRFENKQDMLVGELVLPQTPGPHPAIVIVTGDGEAKPAGRFQTISQNMGSPCCHGISPASVHRLEIGSI